MTAQPCPLRGVRAFTRLVTFNVVECFGNGQIEVKWVGNKP